MLSARQLLLMRRTRDRAIYIYIAPFGTVVFLPDPDFRRRVFRCVGHVGLSCVLDRLAELMEWRAWLSNHGCRRCHVMWRLPHPSIQLPPQARPASGRWSYR